jgi:hypothetical protein
MVSELPAFLHHLEQWQVPDALADDRYGIAAYQHKGSVEKLEQTTPGQCNLLRITLAPDPQILVRPSHRL